MHSLAFINFKGGVAKTTSVVNLGAALAAAGKRVLLVDADPQSHVARHLGLAQSDIGEGLGAVLRQRDPDIRPIVLETNIPNLLVAPSNNGLLNARADLALRPMREALLKRALHSVEDAVDYVLIDSPPDEGVLSINALFACDHLVIPTTLDQFAVDGLPKVLAIRSDMAKAFGRSWPLLGALICRYDRRDATVNRATIKALESVLDENGEADRVMVTRIRTDASVKKAHVLGQTLLEYASETRSTSNAAEDYKALAAELQRRLEGRQTRVRTAGQQDVLMSGRPDSGTAGQQHPSI